MNKIKAQKPEEAESAMGFFGKWRQYIMQSSMAESGQFYDAQAAIKKHDQEAYDVLLKNAENKRDGYLKKAEEEVKKAAEAAKKGNIGGISTPSSPGRIRKRKPSNGLPQSVGWRRILPPCRLKTGRKR
ncbi:hypothetical protein BFINE_56080 [Bacteroides finegoldii DSM 17565]|nr:hypothetical protein BFINE_56080 [Bacteroides finegoldii DSM 17565]